MRAIRAGWFLLASTTLAMAAHAGAGSPTPALLAGAVLAALWVPLAWRVSARGHDPAAWAALAAAHQVAGHAVFMLFEDRHAMGAGHLSMLAAHVGAAVVTTLLTCEGERWLRALAAVCEGWLAPLPSTVGVLPSTPRRTYPTGPAAAPVVHAPVRLLRRRGPPRALVA